MAKKSRIFFIWALIRGALLTFLIAQGLEGPLVARPEVPMQPIRVWQGLASWYGPDFHGRPTANGEIYDMFSLTAAHPTLPMGSLVRISNPATGQSLIVRINDRGPFIEGREIDLSYRAACLLGISEQGLAKLLLELIEVPERPWQPTQSGL